MRTQDAIKRFGSIADLAAALGIKAPSVYEWGEYPPDAKQVLIERVTAGELRAEPGCLDRLIGMDKLPATDPALSQS